MSSPDPSLDGWPDAQIPPETPLPSCPERSVGLSLPLPISARLDLGRRRHDLEALVAYAAYKRRSPEGSKTKELANEMTESEPLEA